MKNFIAGVIITVVAIFISMVASKKRKNEIQSALEKAYFEGQKDAINNDIRISFKDSIYHWVKSPWNNGKNPIFTPTKEDN